MYICNKMRSRLCMCSPMFHNNSARSPHFPYPFRWAKGEEVEEKVHHHVLFVTDENLVPNVSLSLSLSVLSRDADM